jgi:DNA-binding IscR family transcriptional regulator
MRSILGKRARARTKASRFDQEGNCAYKEREIRPEGHGPSGWACAGRDRPGRRNRQDEFYLQEIPRSHLDRTAERRIRLLEKGWGGGYALAYPANEIRVGAIIRLLDGPLAPIACASVTAFRPCADCNDLRACAVRLVMIEARNAVADLLDNRTLAELRAQTNLRARAYILRLKRPHIRPRGNARRRA